MYIYIYIYRERESKREMVPSRRGYVQTGHLNINMCGDTYKQRPAAPIVTRVNPPHG